MWIPRAMKTKIFSSSQGSPVVLLTGARQAGKSSLLKKIFPEARYVTFDHLHHVEAARTDPVAFCRGLLPGPVILDEIQYVPELFRGLKILIDEQPHRCGQWLLTGSQQFSLMDHFHESLPGRVSILELGTLSAQELRSAGVQDLTPFLWRGGHPQLWSNGFRDPGDFFESSLRSYLERDLTALIRVKDLFAFRRFFRLLATRTGQILNYADLASNTGVSDVTCRTWLSSLQISGLIRLIPPYQADIGKRIVKTPKLYFADHGLACHLLGIRSRDEWNLSPYRGQLWENFVGMELIKTEHLIPGDNLFFYRDHSGANIDFIIDSVDTLTFIEARDVASLSQTRLNFRKVVPLFRDRTCATLAALNTLSTVPLAADSTTILNPLLTKMFDTIPTLEDAPVEPVKQVRAHLPLPKHLL